MTHKIFLPPKKAEKVHRASLKVLAETGVKLDHEGAEKLFIDAGAERDNGRLLIPEKLVQQALDKMHSKEKLQLYDRDGEKATEVVIGKSRFGPGSDALYNIDFETGEKRKSVLSDVANNVRVADALPNFDFMMSMALPEDVEKKKLYSTIFAEMVKNSPKPIIATSTSMEDIEQTFTIATITAGSERKFYEKPFFIAYLEPISPLIMDHSGTERLIFCAQKGIPILYAAGANCGSGAPVTPEGGVVQGTAESLAGLVLATLVNDDARFIFGANTSAMDMRSTIISYGDPVWFKTVAMYADMGKFYNLPSWGTAGSSDSFQVDAQAAMEAYEGISLVLMSGTTLAHDVGFLAHGELYDARMLVLTDMMIGRSKHVLKPVDLSEEALAVDVIDEVARGQGIYVSHEHTSRNFKEALWIPPKYINRRYITDIMEAEFPELLKREVMDILENTEPRRMTEDRELLIDSYINSI